LVRLPVILVKTTFQFCGIRIVCPSIIIALTTFYRLYLLAVCFSCY
jgi:hypothetical protein